MPSSSKTLAGALPRLLAVVTAVIALDQWTKLLAVDALVLGEPSPVVSGLLNFTLVRNSGMAFGLLSRSDLPYKALLVTALSIAAMAAVTYYALTAPAREWLTRLGLSFILGGAVGNVIDRARLGYVVDFVDVYYGDAHWPAFNVADSFICIGVGLLILESLRSREPEPAVDVSARVGEGGT